MLRLRIDPEKPYRAPFICQDGLCCCNMALISFRLFRKTLGNLRDFFGQMVYRPPLVKNFPYAYGGERDQFETRSIRNKRGRMFRPSRFRGRTRELLSLAILSLLRKHSNKKIFSCRCRESWNAGLTNT